MPEETNAPEETNDVSKASSNPQVDATPPADEDGGKTFTQSQLDGIIERRLKRERDKWNAEKEEIERRARMDELERTNAEKEELQRKLQETEAAATEATRTAMHSRALAGKVVDLDAALKLISDDELTNDGELNVSGFLDRYPFLKPNKTPTPVDAMNSATPPDDNTPLTPADFRGKSPAWIRANKHRLRPKE